jgi:hypothetical protein
MAVGEEVDAVDQHVVAGRAGEVRAALLGQAQAPLVAGR